MTEISLTLPSSTMSQSGAELDTSTESSEVEKTEDTRRSLFEELESEVPDADQTIPHTITPVFCEEKPIESETEVSSPIPMPSATVKTLVPGPWRSKLKLAGNFGENKFEHSFDDFHDGLNDIVERCLRKLPKLKEKNSASLGISFITQKGKNISIESIRCDHPTDGAYVFVSGAKTKKHTPNSKKNLEKSTTADEESPVAFRNLTDRTPPAKNSNDGRSSLALQQSRVNALLKQKSELTDSPETVLTSKAFHKVNSMLNQNYFGINGQFPEFFLSHTEQIIMQYLDDHLETRINDFKKELDQFNKKAKVKKDLVGVFLNIHTYRAVCKTCRACLVRSLESSSRGFGKVLDELKKLNPNFKTGILISSNINHQGAHSTDHDTHYDSTTTAESLDSLKFIQKTLNPNTLKNKKLLKSSLSPTEKKKKSCCDKKQL